MTAPLVVETDLALRQTTCNGRPHVADTTAVLRWYPADPWAVVLDFAHGPSWVFGWELLAAAVRRGRAGVPGGDVAILPLGSVRRRSLLGLRSPTGSAAFLVDPIDLTAFVSVVAPRQAAAVRPWIPDTADALLDAIHTAHEETL